jgi:hypothetical protein
MSTSNEYAFMRTLGRAVQSGAARTIALTGNVHDLFASPSDERYVPLIDYLAQRVDVGTFIPVLYELNSGVRFLHEDEEKRVREAWVRFHTGLDAGEAAIESLVKPRRSPSSGPSPGERFDRALRETANNSRLALEFLRQLCHLSRQMAVDIVPSSEGEPPKSVRRPLIAGSFIMLIEGADLLVPEASVAGMSEANLHRLATCNDWFTDIEFMDGRDTVVLIAESRSLLHHRIARLPQLLEVAVAAPGLDERLNFVKWHEENAEHAPKYWSSAEGLAAASAGLSLHALRQLLVDASYDSRIITERDVTERVEQFVRAQLGEDVVSFHQPHHTLEDVVGFTDLKRFLRETFIPRILRTDGSALSGAAVGGPIGAGKTFIFEGVAGELGIPVLLLKNLRSKWFGETDVIFERLRRVLGALSKVLIFVDEADTQFGGVGAEAHETERRLTGKIQAMMSDPRLRGRVHWLLMTARIHQLSPDIRRPGRVGSLIIPVLDPESSQDRNDFLLWALSSAVKMENVETPAMNRIERCTEGYSAAAYAALRSEIKAACGPSGVLTVDAAVAIAEDMISPAIEQTRRYQTLQAVLNCTRKSLLPESFRDVPRPEIEREIRSLEAMGIR